MGPVQALAMAAAREVYGAGADKPELGRGGDRGLGEVNEERALTEAGWDPTPAALEEMPTPGRILRLVRHKAGRGAGVDP